MFGWFRKRTLESALNTSYRVKVHGVIFHIRKLNPIDFLTGAKAIRMHFETYKTAGQKEQLAMLEQNGDKITEHYRDVIMSCVISPKLSRKENKPGAIYVENLFTDWELVNELYLRIMELTYGKKKLKSLASQKTA